MDINPHLDWNWSACDLITKHHSNAYHLLHTLVTRHSIAMADTEPEKTAPQEYVHTSTDFPDGAEVELPQGWMYRSRKLGPITFPWYASPQSQLILVAFVCFLCPGKYQQGDTGHLRQY